MELEELKMKWQEMDSRLSKVEMLNKQMLSDLLKRKIDDNFKQLHSRTAYGMGAGLLVMIVMIPVILTLPLTVASQYAIVAFMAIGFAFFTYRFTLISRLQITEPTGVLLKYMLRERKAFLVDKYVGLPMILVLYVLVICFESSWIIERGKMMEAILMMGVISIVVVYSQVQNNRRYGKLLSDIEQQLKELEQ